MRFSTTLILLTLVAGLGIFVFTYERNLPGTKQLLLEETQPFSFAPEEVQEIEITAKDKRVTLQLKDGLWRVLSPYQDRANQELVAGTVQGVIETTWQEKLKRKDLKSEDYRRTGLRGNSSIDLLLKNAEGKALAKVAVGSKGSFEESAFMAINDEDNEFYLAKTKLADLLSTNLDVWRDAQLTREKVENVKSFTVSSGNGIMEFTREKGRAWQVVKPLQTRGDNARINAVLSSMLKLEVHVNRKKEANAAPLPATMLPEMKIQLEYYDRKKPEILTFRPNLENYSGISVEVGDRVGLFDANPLAESFWKLQPNHLRDQHLVQLQGLTVNQVLISSRRYGKVELEVDGPQWVLNRFGQKSPANTKTIESLFEALQKEPILDFVSDTGLNADMFGFNQPFMEIQLIGPDHKQHLQFAANIKGEFYAKYADEPFIYAIGQDLFEKFPAEATKWQSLKVIDANLFTARRIIISEDTKPTLTLLYQPETGAWTGTLGEQDITERIVDTQANAYLQNLVSYEIHEWITERAPAYEALKNPSLTLQLLNSSLENPSAPLQPTTLRLAPITPGVHTALYYGQIDGKIDPFYITRAAYEALLRLPIKKD